jgi:glucose-6-phosphate isomerase
MTSDRFAAIAAHRTRTAQRPIRELFADTDRFQRFSAEADGLLLDYSKTALDDDARALLIQVYEQSGVAARRDAMFDGARINETENRAVLHTALRSAETAPLVLDGTDIRPEIAASRDATAAFAEGVRRGAIAAADGAPFTDVVNIGIGGSDLGPRMAVGALAPYHDGPRFHFIANVDGADVTDTLQRFDPERTLVIVASKTFTTAETMTNARTVKAWLTAALGERANTHLAAVSSAVDRAEAFGIDRTRVFGFGDYVGGRYSLWGPIGLPILLAIGAERFAEFLAGGAAMDAHFRSAPPEANLPVLLALVGIWHRNACGYPTRAVLPYDERLARLPAYLQQLDMESNGKRVRLDGTPADATGPVVWGEPGTNGQHAFFQLLHQGSEVVPCEFLVAARGHEAGLDHQHRMLLANCLAQSEALMNGRDAAAARALAETRGFDGDAAGRMAAQLVFPGNRPSVTLLYDRLTPFRLGQIIALYEHRVFVEGAIWGINSFDQWGVELGKEIATAILPLIEDGALPDAGSTAGLIAAIRALRRG